MSNDRVKTALSHLEDSGAIAAIKTLARSGNKEKLSIVRDTLWASLFMTDAELDAVEAYLKPIGYKEPRNDPST